MAEGIPIEKNIYRYLISDTVHFDQYSVSDAFAQTGTGK